ncbi:hypothetical protein DAEQUDRAFT_812451 [Daedalea quercina L-15889]|uniref:DUF6533 domain-containing protein n=1 Tax=Daedalea quercina L-15889 TaxID=1314783 RepID=A0A165P934_9APHY|nr:hypothetical protein DAEQUDRAFT_812451 [Daedalea quercina L-15889]
MPSLYDILFHLVVSTSETSFFQNYLSLAPIVLIVYDYFLTFDKEVRLLWSRKLHRAAAVLFILIRFDLLGYVVAVLLGLATCPTPRSSQFGAHQYSPESLLPCVVANGLSAIGLFMLSIVLTAIVSTMRVYAVSGKNKYVTILTLFLGIVSAATGFYEAQAESYLYPTSRISAIASDVVVLAATWRNTFHTMKLKLRGQSVERRITWYFLRDGTFYFSAMVILNVIDIFSSRWTGRFTSAPDIFTRTMTYPLSVLFLSRLLINLREASHSSGSPSERSGFLDVHDPPTEDETIVFASEQAGGMESHDTSITGSFSPDIIEGSALTDAYATGQGTASTQDENMIDVSKTLARHRH